METTLNIQNLKCGGCANTIITRLENLEGITSVLVNNEEHTVSFQYEHEAQLVSVTEMLDKLGYPVEGESNSFGKKAKSYVSCAIGRINA